MRRRWAVYLTTVQPMYGGFNERLYVREDGEVKGTS